MSSPIAKGKTYFILTGCLLLLLSCFLVVVSSNMSKARFSQLESLLTQRALITIEGSVNVFVILSNFLK